MTLFFALCFVGVAVAGFSAFVIFKIGRAHV